ncbi:uncharacterized protein [Dermacentor andersoni]|uniref:uncharacterized protein n=1 Tax=Dermacentor andersoni TaxID=34620 RepID=UPI002155D83F|nr:uncharacterized protein LOC126529182 [Dermacentor andersoni]XP_054925431.1 uncharacterized protein LOC126529182 [Dermacentor andersoni]
MATAGNDTEAALAPHGANEVSYQLADLEGATGCFSGNVINYRMPCTATEATACQIVSHLPVWNELLCWLDLELRELSETGGQLGLVDFPMTHAVSCKSDDKLQQAVTLVCWLLKTHRCVVSVHIPNPWDGAISSKLYRDIFWKALHGNSSIKYMTLKHWSQIENASFYKIYFSLKCLEELELGSFSSHLQISQAISMLSQTTRTLTKLHMPFMPRVERTQAMDFFAALIANSRLRDLTLGSNIIGEDPTSFLGFLASTTTLQHLSVFECYGVFRDNTLKWVFEGMLKNRTVCSLEARDFVLESESVELGARMLAENNVLTNFKFLSCVARYSNLPTTQLIRLGMRADIVTWAEAISQNNALQYATLSFGICTAEQWGSFFRVLSKRRNLKMVTIDVREDEYGHLASVVKDLEGSGSEEKVSFTAPCGLDTLALSECKRCSELEAYLPNCNDLNLIRVFQQLHTFSHLNTMSLRINRWDSTISFLIADYIATTSTLQKLHMQFSNAYVPPESLKWWPALSRSLRLNRSITDLGIGVDAVSCEDVMLVADAIIQSATIRKICLLRWSSPPLPYFTRHLGAGILKNRTLCSATSSRLYVPWDSEWAADWFAVRNTARRNSTFVARAAQFLKHARRDRLCAAGLDRVSRHPALVAELAQVLSVDEPEAADMVRQNARRIEGLHDFMRLAGVVKEQVTCLPRQDGRMQLDGLNQDCWARVRRYLELDDVGWEYPCCVC